VPRFAAYWPLAMRSIECVYFTGVPAPWLSAWLSAWLSYAFPMLFLGFYSFPGGKIRVPRFAAYWPPAMRSIECVYFTGVPAHLQYKGF
jgi:hypothetical protein